MNVLDSLQIYAPLFAVALAVALLAKELFLCQRLTSRGLRWGLNVTISVLIVLFFVQLALHINALL